MKPKKPTCTNLLEKLSRNRFLTALLSLLLFLLIWQLLVVISDLPAFILPTPQAVLLKFVELIGNGTLWKNASATLLELSLGLLCGCSAGIILGYLLSRSPLMEKLLSPFLVGSQSVPVAAIAPLLVIWFGAGLLSKTLICALTVFFPVLINVLVGLRDVPENLRELFASMQATRWQTLRHLELPSSLPVVLAGLRVGVSLSVIGAIVGELVGASRGLGYLIQVGRGQYDTSLVFVAVFSLMLIASCLYGLVLLLERKVLSWQTWRKD